MSHVRDRFVADLPSSGDYRLERLVVVSAYTSDAFIPDLVRALKPRAVYVVLDESTPRRIVESIASKVPKRSLRRLALGVAPRIMHAKLYLLTWVKNGGTYRIHRLHFGSANASEAGFGNPGNAESLASTRVLARHTEAMSWFEAIAAGAPAVDAVSCRVDDLSLDLPAFAIRDPDATPQFDSWLQRGVLCHKHQRDPAFLRLSVKLEQPLPRDEVAKEFEAAGLIDEDGRRHLRFSYLGDDAAEDADRPPARWLVRHFVETLLGHWTSDRCYRAREREFFVQGKARRRREVDQVGNSGVAEHDRWVGALLNAIRTLEGRLGPDRVGQWLKTSTPGRVDLEVYERAARRQLARDVTKARNPDYSRRYVQGVDFLPVPRFRGETEEWERFALSFAEILTYQLQKGKVDSGIARVLADADVLSPDAVGEEALESIRKRWPDVHDEVEAMLLEGMNARDDEA